MQSASLRKSLDAVRELSKSMEKLRVTVEIITKSWILRERSSFASRVIKASLHTEVTLNLTKAQRMKVKIQ